ncbi:MAG: hypothetical protein JWQ66_2932 [Mucilaginibacter sp.]|nr:hypothetical protein [Mucilaginibacter sp.]
MVFTAGRFKEDIKMNELNEFIPYTTEQAERDNQFLTDLLINQETGEVFKSITDYEQYYSISSSGRVFSHITSKILKPGLSHNGYLSVVLCANKKKSSNLVHRLVATAFCANASKILDVNHIDGVKTNNNSKNLEWCTRQENIIHSHKLGLSPNNLPVAPSGNEHFNCRQVAKICKETGIIIKSYKAILDARKDGYKASTISMCLTGKNKTAYGFKWNYISQF